MLVNAQTVLNKAQRGRYAVGAFNVYNVETVQAVIRAAEALKAPVIVQTSEAAIKYAGLDTLARMIQSMAASSSIPIVLHLDHGKDLTLIKKCIAIGYTSVMFDGSLLPFEKNVALTKKVVAWAQPKQVSVEAEIGILGGKEDTVVGKEGGYTKPAQAVAFYKATKCNSLAIAIGTSHGAFKQEAHRLRFEILGEVKKKVPIPIVLHGASMVDHALIKAAEKTGLELAHAQGVAAKDIKKAIKLGICKVNVDTDLRLAFTTAIRAFTQKNSKDINPRDILSSATAAAEKSVMQHITLFGSKGKA